MASADFLRFVVTVHFFPNASARPPRVLTRSFPLYPPHLPEAIPCSYWALFCMANSPSLPALYAISVRQARVLPIGRPFNSQNPAFFRFHLAMDTLAVGYRLGDRTLPSGLSPCRDRPCGAHCREARELSNSRASPILMPKGVRQDRIASGKGVDLSQGDD